MPVKAGDAYIVTPGSCYRETGHFDHYWICFNGTNAEAIMSKVNIQNRNHTYRLGTGAFERIHSVFRDIATVDLKRISDPMFAVGVLLELASLFGENAVGDTPSGSTDTTGGGSTTPVDTTTGKYDPGLAARDFESYAFTFAVRGHEGDPYQWNNTDIYVESETGDTLNDAFYKRNTYLKDTYNVNINVLFAGNTGTGTTGSEMYEFINKSIMSNESEFDAILSSPYDSIGYVMSDFVVDLNTVPNLNLEREWWDQNAHEQLAFGDSIYITTGEVTIIDNKATHAYVFNKQLVDDYNIEDPYELVRNGQWTIDKLSEVAKMGIEDLNGDGYTDPGDRFGLWIFQDASMTFVTSTGNAIGQINANGEPELTLYTERMVSTWEKVNALMTSGNVINPTWDAPDSQKIHAMFGGNQAVFAWASIADIIDMRSLDVDFGIIPAPKYDEEQENYITTPHAYGNTMMTVPVTNTDLDRTGFILEAFTAKSAEIVTPAFYNITLEGKVARDDESLEMLELIFANKSYDIGLFFMWGNYTNLIMNAFNSNDPNFTSMYEANEQIAHEDIAKIADKFN